MNFVINQMIDFDLLDSSKSALYATNLDADQRTIRKRSEMTRKSVSSIDILSSKTLVVCISTFSSMKRMMRIIMITKK
jgi:hypothetical protein